MAAMGRDIKLSEERIAGYQNFINKLWNAARFAQMHRADAIPPSGENGSCLNNENLDFAERWIRARLAFAIAEARQAIDSYRFNDFASVLYQFTWHEFCDWYIEMSKLALTSSDPATANRSRTFLRDLLDQILLLLHPLVPFVTEEIWQVLGDRRDSIMVQPYPVAQPSWFDSNTDQKMAFLMDVIRAIRNLRTEMNCPPGREVKVIFHGAEVDLDFLREHQPYLRSLARVGTTDFRQSGERPKGAATAVVGGMEIYLPLDESVNLDEERTRLSKEVSKIEVELARVQKKLANSDFISKAKAEVIQKEKEKAVQFEEKIRTLRSSLQKIEELRAGGDS
jgi:valyl-tRNA synthetase